MEEIVGMGMDQGRDEEDQAAKNLAVIGQGQLIFDWAPQGVDFISLMNV